MREQLVELERELHKIPGVTGARVVGESEPTEIHIVADPGRPAKQVVRDVQSLASAGFGMPIDHRIVSVVQLEQHKNEVLPPPLSAPDDIRPKVRIRPAVQRVVFAARAEVGWVKVALTWPNGETTEGVGACAATRESRARGAMTAVVQALHPALKAMSAGIDIEHIVVQRVGESDSVTVRALFHENGSSQSLVGTAVITDDVASAGVNALLHAVNRKLEMAAV